MKIGIDISSLQGPHRMRGIGSVASNFIKNIPNNNVDTFVFFIYDNMTINMDDTLDNIKLKSGNYEVRRMNSHRSVPEKWKQNKFLDKLIIYAGKIKKLKNSIFQLLLPTIIYVKESKRFGNTKDLDVFIQLDQSGPLAILNKNARNYIIAYDIIPYLLESDYLWSYRTARLNGLKISESIKKALDRINYINKLRYKSKNSEKILAISENTKKDFEKYLHIPAKKIDVVSLGLDSSIKKRTDTTDDGIIDRYYDTPWGYITKKESLKNKRFLLFVGGADPRRKLNDVVTAFNHLRAQGEDIKLVLSGDVMLGPSAIPVKSAREALLNSSYSDDIFFLGFTDTKTRDWLYAAALAFVFPSIYEGFGLPVIEAMQYHTPVIAYDNKAVKEIAKDYPIYAHDSLSIVAAVERLNSLSRKDLVKMTDKAHDHSRKYTWSKATNNILRAIK